MDIILIMTCEFLYWCSYELSMDHAVQSMYGILYFIPLNYAYAYTKKPTSLDTAISLQQKSKLSKYFLKPIILLLFCF